MMWSVPHSWHITPRKDLVSIVWEAEWAFGLICTSQNVLPPTGFNPRTFQLVVSDCINYGTPGHVLLSVFGNFAALFTSFF